MKGEDLEVTDALRDSCLYFVSFIKFDSHHASNRSSFRRIVEARSMPSRSPSLGENSAANSRISRCGLS